MHIPIQVDYGVRALVDLTNHEGKGVVRAIEISQRQGIPQPYLAHVLRTLNKNGIVKSLRGPLGGHSLAMAPSDITVSMVMNFLGGSTKLVSCLADLNSCDQSPVCGQRDVWREAEAALNAVLQSKTIADIACTAQNLSTSAVMPV